MHVYIKMLTPLVLESNETGAYQKYKSFGKCYNPGQSTEAHTRIRIVTALLHVHVDQ